MVLSFQPKHFAFNRTHTIYVVFQFRGFYDVPRVLIMDATSFQALAAILDTLGFDLMLVSIRYQTR